MEKNTSGFTLIETLVAISLLMLALIAPMSLAAQALTTAYFSRDQITAYYLAQEGIETVRAVRDANIIALAEGQSVNDVFCTATYCIPYGTTASNAPAFTSDATQPTSQALQSCGVSACAPLKIYCSTAPNGLASCVYGYTSGGTNTVFTRTIKAYLVNSSDKDELRVAVTVSWYEGTIAQNFTINEDLYRWVQDGGND